MRAAGRAMECLRVACGCLHVVLNVSWLLPAARVLAYRAVGAGHWRTGEGGTERSGGAMDVIFDVVSVRSRCVPLTVI